MARHTRECARLPLTTTSQWKLARSGEALVIHAVEPEPPAGQPTPPPPPGRPVATLDFDEKRRLRVTAEVDTQFHELKGFNITESNNRQLNIAPGERLVCRVATSDLPSAVRLEMNYNKDRRA